MAERLRLATRWVAPAGTELSEVGWLMGCFLLGPTAFLRSLGGFDEDFWFHGTDLEICARVHAAGRRVLRWEGELLVHVGHRDWPADRVRKSRAALAQFLRRDHGWSASTAVSVLTASLRASLR